MYQYQQQPHHSQYQYVDDELPLPSYDEVFAFLLTTPSGELNMTNKRQRMSSSQSGYVNENYNRMSNDNTNSNQFDNNNRSGKIIGASTHSCISNDNSAGIHKKRKAYNKKPASSEADSTAGRWTSEEHQMFLKGVMMFGREWKKMVPLIKTRTVVQIRTHAQKVFKKDFPTFTLKNSNNNNNNNNRTPLTLANNNDDDDDEEDDNDYDNDNDDDDNNDEDEREVFEEEDN